LGATGAAEEPPLCRGEDRQLEGRWRE
jgi:hypothetical protein